LNQHGAFAHAPRGYLQRRANARGPQQDGGIDLLNDFLNQQQPPR